MSTNQSTELFKQDGYIYLPGLLVPALTGFLTNYVTLRAQSGEMIQDPQCPKSLAMYGDPAFDTILAGLTPYFSMVAGEPLLPTYTYHRLYKKGDVLEIHRDRPSCEISCTISIGVDDPNNINPLYVNMREPSDMDDGKPIAIKVGDGVLYKGTELYHWRKPYENEWFIQVFLHYVRANGQYRENIFDGRPALGTQRRAA